MGKPVRPIRAFGEEKSISEWACDERCVVSVSGLTERLNAGWEPEIALTMPPYGEIKKENLAVFGETKTIFAWAADPRCSVSHQVIRHRINYGWSPERAITEPAAPKLRFRTRMFDAFGERKTIADWARDNRCQVTDSLLRNRLNKGWGLEEAMCLPRYVRRVSRANPDV